MAETEEITILFNWNTCSADSRQYNQQRQLLHPVYRKDDDFLQSIRVAVRIPLTREFVFNTAAILENQLAKDGVVPDPVLTPQGMFLAISLLEKPFAKAGEKVKEDLSEAWEPASKKNPSPQIRQRFHFHSFFYLTS